MAASKSVRQIDGVWRSRCKRCGAEIVRVRPEKWGDKAKVDMQALRQELLRHLGQRYAMIEQSGPDFRVAFSEYEVVPSADPAQSVEYRR